MLILFFIDIILIGLFAFSLAAWLRLPAGPAWLAGVLVLAYAAIVLAAEGLGSIGRLQPGPFLAWHAVLAAGGVALWWRAGRPGWPVSGQVAPRKFWAFWRERPALGLLAAAVGLAYLVNAYLVFIVPPNNWDSMTYHLARIGYWLQYDSFYPWVTHNLRQTTSPINAELGLLWTIIFWGTDQVAGYVQWLAALLGGVAIFGLARFLHCSRPQGLFAALIWATLPQVVLQSTTTQNDLVVSAFTVAAIYFFFLGFRSNHNGALLLSGLALGLAIGTKLTVGMALPGLALGAGLLGYQRGASGFGPLLKWAVSCLAGFLLLGAYTYGLNLAAYGAPLGPPDYIESAGGAGSDRPTLTAINILRYSYQAADLTGLPPPVHTWLSRAKTGGASALFNAVHIDLNLPNTAKLPFNFPDNIWPHEDTAWWGPVGFLLLFPALAYHGLAGIRRKQFYHLVLVLVAVVFWLMVSATILWSPWRGRYFLLVATACFPLVAGFYREGGAILAGLRWAVILLAILVMGYTITFNRLKPLVGPTAIWPGDKLERRTIIRRNQEPLLRQMQERVPPGARVGLIFNQEDWDYPLFGEHLTRTLVPLHPPDRLLEANRLDRLDYLVVNYRVIESYLDARLLPVLGCFHIVSEHHPYYLLYLGQEELTGQDIRLRERLLEQEAISPEMLLPEAGVCP